MDVNRIQSPLTESVIESHLAAGRIESALQELLGELTGEPRYPPPSVETAVPLVPSACENAADLGKRLHAIASLAERVHNVVTGGSKRQALSAGSLSNATNTFAAHYGANNAANHIG